MSGSGLRHALQRCDWLLVAAISPLMLFPQAGTAWILLLYLLVLGMQWWAWGDVLPLTPLNPAILLVALMTGVSLYVTPDLASSLVKISGVLLGVLVYFTVARHTRTRKGWNGALIAWSLAGMGVAAIGMLGTSWFTTKITALNAVTSKLPVRLLGLQGAEAGIHPNELAGSLLWVVPVLLMAGLSLLVQPKWFASRSGRGKVWPWRLTGWWLVLGLAILTTAGVLVLTQSRGAYLAMLVTGVVVVALIARGRWRWGVLGLVLVGVVAADVLISQVGTQRLADLMIGSLPVGSNALSLTTLNGRVEIWSRAVWAIKDVPLTGLGMNVFRRAIYLLYPPYQIPAGFDPGHAHNEILQAALDLGLPGLVGLLALYAGAVGMVVRVMRGDGVWRLLAIGLLGGLLAHFLFGITDAVALGAKPGFLFWWLLGMVYGAYEQTRAVKVAQA